MTDSAKPTEKIHSASESHVSWRPRHELLPGWQESDIKLKASFCLRFPYTQSLLKATWVSMALLKPDSIFFFFTELIYPQHHESQKHIFAWTQAWNIIHSSLLLSRNALQSTLDTIVKQAWFTLFVMFVLKSWNFLCIFLRKDYYISLPLFCNLGALLTPTPPHKDTP